MKKTALVSGILGQDGAYLAKLLLSKGYEVIGGARRTASGGTWRLDRLGITDQVKIVDFELTEFGNVLEVIRKHMPDEIYNLGAMSFVGSSFTDPLYTFDTNAVGLINILEAVRLFPHVNDLRPTKVYQASTSEMFGKVQEIPQKETTPFHPRSPYGVAKLAAYWAGVNYRESYDMFVCNGILFNHESPLRGKEFVTKKIVQHCVGYSLGLTRAPLRLGNLNAKRDWGYAADYVEAMYLMMQQDKPDDYVIATGETHTIGEFLIEVCNYLGEFPEVIIDPQFMRPADVELLIGDASKAKRVLGWEAKTKFKELVKLMVEDELLCYKGSTL